MIRGFIHRVISLVAVLIVVLPMSIQFAHALENHNHEVCNENSIQHFHSLDNECEFDHFVFKTNTNLSHTDFQLAELLYIDSPINTKSTNHHSTLLSTRLYRGPPKAII